MPVPTDEAWEYFTKHLDAIRGVCAAYLPARRMEVPNTRVMAGGAPVRREETGEEQRDSVPLAVTHTIEDFDDAVRARDSIKLATIMNRAWPALPEDSAIYREPGVTEMCNLLDCTVDGFFEDPDEDRDQDDKEEPAF